MFGLSPIHLLLLALVVLVLFGRGKVSEFMGDFGKGIKSFKEGMNDDSAHVMPPSSQIAAPVTTPVTSSVGAPVAQPVGAPVAQPVAAPVASPIAAPAHSAPIQQPASEPVAPQGPVS